jgi:MYXO-CTERM domain-containing protein
MGTSSLTSDEWDDVINRAFFAWTAVDCGGGKHPSLSLEELRPVTCAKSEFKSSGPNVNVVYFEDSGWSGKDMDSTYATTKTHFDQSGEIMDADIAINSARFDLLTGNDTSGGADLLSILTHEVGHFYGLDHSNEPGAVMYWSLAPGEVRRKLSADDIAGICTLYPPDRDAACDYSPRGGLGDSCPDVKVGCSASPGDAATSSLPPLVLGALGLIAARIRRWRSQAGPRSGRLQTRSQAGPRSGRLQRRG